MGTNFNYEEFTKDTADLIYQRDAFVPTDRTFLRLTKTNSSSNPEKNSIGRVVYSPAVQLWKPGGSQASFHTTFKFVIMNVDDYPADGIAFFMAPVDYPLGSAGGGLGIYNDSNSGLKYFAVELDTHKNSWDPEDKDRHVGINVNSHKSERAENFDSVTKEEVTAAVDYDATANRITVNGRSSTQTASVSHVKNLKDILPQTVQVGISSATGNRVAIHDLMSWSFSSTEV